MGSNQLDQALSSGLKTDYIPGHTGVFIFSA